MKSKNKKSPLEVQGESYQDTVPDPAEDY